MRKDLYEDMYQTEDEHWWHRSKRRYIKYFISKYSKEKNRAHILDVGCGTGKNMEELSQYGKIWGVDPSDDALRFCKERGLTNVQKGEAERLPFKEGAFDFVCVLDVLEHVDDIAALQESKRVLKNNGFILITVPAFHFLWSKWDEVLHHKRRYTKEHLKEVLEKEGFVIQKNTYIYSFLLLPSLIIRKLKQLQKKSYTSDFQINNNAINKFLLFASELEQSWINRYDMPFGTSVLCIAQKKDKNHASP
jgi:ubiquinone/menaquinone biosynthesis C-methylase UbiE